MGITVPWPGAVPGPPKHPTLAVTLWVPVSPSLQFNDLERAFSEFLVRLSSGNTNSRKRVQYRTYILIKSTPHQKKKISVSQYKNTRMYALPCTAQITLEGVQETVLPSGRDQRWVGDG